MMKKQFLLFAVLALLTFQEVSAQIKEINREGVHIEYPQEWKEIKMPGHVILVKEPASEEWGVQATFDVEIHDKVHDLDRFVENYKKEVKGFAKNCHLLSEKKIKFKGYKAVELICTGVVAGIPIKWKTIMLVKDGKLYKFTSTNALIRYDKTEPVTEKIFQSVKWE